jgi:hypothetical protein
MKCILYPNKFTKINSDKTLRDLILNVIVDDKKKSNDFG